MDGIEAAKTLEEDIPEQLFKLARAWEQSYDRESVVYQSSTHADLLSQFAMYAFGNRIKTLTEERRELYKILKELIELDENDEYFVDSFLGIQGAVKNHIIRVSKRIKGKK